ncbi:MAG: DUF4900 domain-containing protein [Candidatus Omnitrophica bacterium]|nr:DUF4900 domain-containing protein [Candidatus Omnitrophota bacterium]
MFARLGNRKGMALVLVFGIISVLLVFVATFMTTSIGQNISSEIFRRRTKAFNLAEAGLDHAIIWLRAQGAPPVGNMTNPWGGIEEVGGGYYNVTITDLGAIGASGSIRRYRVASQGVFKNSRRTLSNLVQVDNYARYLWFTDRETFSGTNVWFWSSDRLNGPTHTNTHFNIALNPIFEGEVRSVDPYIRFYNNGNNVNLPQLSNAPFDLPVFQQGVDFGIDPITMPSQALSLRAAATDNGLSLRGDTTVVLRNDGTMNVTNARRDWVNQNMPLPANGALFVTRGSLTVSGTLNGQLTVGAARDIIIPDNIVYADNPIVNPQSDDVLGIIAERDVVIDNSAPQDLEINGCVMAMDTSFMMEDWWIGPPKGVLTVLGGIIQDERGPVGTFNGFNGQKVSGYSKNYRYDSRLLTNPPPFMPTTGDYVTLSWEER